MSGSHQQGDETLVVVVDNQQKHANRHVAAFLALPTTTTTNDPDQEATCSVQVVKDGRQLTAKRLLIDKIEMNDTTTTNTHNKESLTLSRPILVVDQPKSIGMKVLLGKNDHHRQYHQQRDNDVVTVRDIADIIGHHQPVHVMNVEHQEELKGWTMADLVEYFEDEERLFLQAQQEVTACHRQAVPSATATVARRRRKAAEKCLSAHAAAGRPRVLNQISLEFSNLPLKEKIWSPQFVRDLDWIDQAWPRRQAVENDSIDRGSYPTVQYYCLTSAAGSYTDFHVDFGGTSVWYHVLSGEKTFCLIPPSPHNLAIYEEWLGRADQADIFLPDLILSRNKKNAGQQQQTNGDDCGVVKVSLKASQTLIIPTAWIHAVYTPVDAVVVGGNFLHGLDMDLQLKIHSLESRTRVLDKFRFPFFVPIHFYAGGMYLEKMRRGHVSMREMKGVGTLVDALDEWWKKAVSNQEGEQPASLSSSVQKGPTATIAANHVARKNGCSTVDEFLSALRAEYHRVLKEGIQPNSNLSSPISTTKSKLKITLSAAKRPPSIFPSPISSPKTPIKIGGSSMNKGKEKFRITLSSKVLVGSSSPPAGVTMKKSKRVREDTEWTDEGPGVDDDWSPSKSAAKKQARSQQSRGRSDIKSMKGRSVSKPSSSSARKRLMKRLR